MIYVGCRYARGCHPDDLLKSYFTSSKRVKSLMARDGISSFCVIKILTRADAREYESRYLKRVFSKLGSSGFTQLLLNRNIAPGILNDAESLAKAAVKKKVSNSLSQKRLFKEGRHNWQNLTQEQLGIASMKKSASKIGNRYGAMRKITDEYRKSAAEKSKGNTNVRGTVWWTDGVVFKRSREKPGESFYRGAPTSKKETK